MLGVDGERVRYSIKLINPPRTALQLFLAIVSFLFAAVGYWQAWYFSEEIESDLHKEVHKYYDWSGTYIVGYQSGEQYSDVKIPWSDEILTKQVFHICQYLLIAGIAANLLLMTFLIIFYAFRTTVSRRGAVFKLLVIILSLCCFVGFFGSTLLFLRITQAFLKDAQEVCFENGKCFTFLGKNHGLVSEETWGPYFGWVATIGASGFSFFGVFMALYMRMLKNGYLLL